MMWTAAVIGVDVDKTSDTKKNLGATRKAHWAGKQRSHPIKAELFLKGENGDILRTKQATAK